MREGAAGKDALIRWRARLQPRQMLDNPFMSFLMGSALLLASRLSFSTSKKLNRLANASRRCETRLLQSWCRRQLRPWLTSGKVDVWRKHRIGWDRYYSGFGNIGEESKLTSSLLLKEPGPNGEKGVLHCPFEFNWMRLITSRDVKKLLSEYYLVGASSWSPTDHGILANLCGLSSDPIFIGISNRADIAQYQMYSPDIEPLPIMASDWRSPRDFNPVKHQNREIDILMVSHFAAWKRHWLLFEALRKMRRNLRVVLIGRNAGDGTEEDIRAQMKAFGVQQDIEIYRNMENDEVAAYQCNARISLALSKREGACVSVTESLFADTPVGMMQAHIGAKAYINDRTGRLLQRRTMPAMLSEMIERSGEFTPRAWASENISAELSSQKLNEILCQHSLRTGKPWTRDIAPFCRRYVPRYLHLEDKMRLQPGLKRLQQEHGIEFKEFISEKHAHSRAS